MPDTSLNDPDALPIPMGVRVATGTARPPISIADAARVLGRPDLVNATARAGSQTTLAPNASVDDLNILQQTGWAVLFASDADPAIKQQLQPLLDLRQSQVETNLPPGLTSRFRVFEGTDQVKGGVLPGQTADNWAQMRQINFTSPVDPDVVPYYLLIVGSPERIPFEFQATFKLQWLAGRLYFDDIADYGRYAAHVVAYETAPWKPLPAKNTAVWVTSNPGDIATMMLSGAIATKFRDSTPQLGQVWTCQYTMDFFQGEAATKQQLQDIFAGNVSHGWPSVVFTGSHGSEFAMPTVAADIEDQRKRQGALITQEWTPGSAVSAACQFTADDIPAQNQLPGMMIFMFACYSVGCPATDNYYFNPNGSPIQAAPAPLISLLAQKLLANGALAVIGHIDRAFPYGFVDVAGTSQAGLIQMPLETLMKGWTAGRAVDCFTSSWSSIAAKLSTNPPPQMNAATALKSQISRDDARNYTLLGDPAVRLRVKNDSQ